MNQHGTPASLGFRMPAEWEPHESTWIAWPHNREDWPGKFGPIPWVYTEIVRHLSQGEIVNILVNDGVSRREAADRLSRAGVDPERMVFHKVRTDRVWTRDTGPIFVVNPELAAPFSVRPIHWRFNGWGKYDDYKHDRRVPRKIARGLGIDRWKPETEIDGEVRRVVLEGGSIDVNGKGTLLTTDECLLSDVQARNPGLSKEAIEQLFADYLGISKVIWLGRGIAGDDTHCHVDDLARFVDASTVVTVVETNPIDENHDALAENLERLQSATDQDGNPLRVVTLPMPRPVIFEGVRLPASYANFYIANGVVLVPTFNDPADRVALDVLGGLFPDRRVVGIHAVDLVWGLGTIHCLTREQPAAATHVENAPRPTEATSEPVDLDHGPAPTEPHDPQPIEAIDASEFDEDRTV